MDADVALIGRSEALRVLDAELDEVRAGHGRFVSVVGDPGIGKTRLVEEFVARAGLDGRSVWGRCPEQPGAPGFWPWRQAIRAYAGLAEPDVLAAELGPAAADVCRVVPELRARLPHSDVVSDVGEETAESRFRVLEGIAGFLRRASEDTPLVLVLDDLHWADAASLQLLGFLARELHGARLLVVGTYRDVELERRPALLDGIERVSQRIHLRGLAEADVRRLVEATAGLAPPPTLVRDLHRVTEGNPLFVKELVRVLRDERALQSRDLATAAVALPNEIRATIRRRVEPLAPDERELLEAAAVLGREFDVTLLVATTALTTDVVLTRLDAALAAGLLEEVAGAVGYFRFAHALIRETIYNDVRPSARAALHRRAAHALEATSHTDAEHVGMLAHHFFSAATTEDAAKALDYLEQAARQATASFAHDRAVEHLERAFEVLAHVPSDDRRRLRLLLALGAAISRVSDVGRARSIFEQAAVVAESLDDVDQLAATALRYQRAGAPIGIVDPTEVRLLERALERRGDARDKLHVSLLIALARGLIYAGDEARVRALGEQALVLARALGDDDGIGQALHIRQYLDMGPAPVEPRIALGREALEHCERGGDAASIGVVRTLLIHDLLEAGDVAGAERQIAVYAQRAEESRLPRRRWIAATLHAAVAISSGRVEEGLTLAARALELPRDAQDPATMMTYCGQAFIARRELGDFGETLEASIARFADVYAGMHSWRCTLALVHADAGRSDTARALLAAIARDDYAWVLRDVHYLPSLALLAEAAFLTDDRERAAELYPMLEPCAGRNIVASYWSPTWIGSAERFLGLLATTLGRVDVAAAHFERAIAANERLGVRAQTAHGKVDYATLLLARDASGDRELALRLLADARDTADELGLSRVRQRVAALGPAPRLRDTTAHAPLARLRRSGEDWELGLGDRTIMLRSSRGLDYLARLVRDPGIELHVLDLVAGTDDGGPALDTGDAGEMLDGDARTAYRRRLTDLEAELEEAERFNDAGRIARAQAEVEFLNAELSRAVGLGGRSRRAAAASERARLNVTRALGRTIEKIAAEDAALGQHLAASVRRGIYCCYEPDPRLPVRWEL